MVVNFSKSCALYDYIFINGNPIEKVDSFKYLGIFFDCDLKWCSNTEYVYSKPKKRFYAFSRFKYFKPNQYQQHNFIQSLIQPIFTYNIELWYTGATERQKNMLLSPFLKNSYIFYADCFVDMSIFNLAQHFIADDRHILRNCYKSNRKYFIMPKTRTSRFLCSFVPFSIRLLNN